MYVVRQSTKSLSNRELEVLHLICYGATNAIMAKTLEISEKTVGAYVERLYRKLGVHNRSQAVMAAASKGLLPG